MKKKTVTIKELLGWFEGYIAKDENGSIYLYQSKPGIDFKNKKWNPKRIDDNFESRYNLFGVFELRDVDWKDSLRCPKIKRKIPTEKTPVGTRVWVRDVNYHNWRKGNFFTVHSDNTFSILLDRWQTIHYDFCEIATEEDIKNGFRED